MRMLATDACENSVFLPNNMPCFKLSEKSDVIQVFLNSEFDVVNSNVIALDVFIPAYSGGYPFSISGDIRSVPS